MTFFDRLRRHPAECRLFFVVQSCLADAERNQRKGHRLTAIFFCYVQRCPITRFQKLLFPMFVIPPTRSNCMDHIFAGQVVSLCDFCAACLAAMQRTALCKQLQSGGTMNAAVHTTTAQKRRLAALTIASTLIFVMSFLIICKGIAYSSPFCTSLNMLFLQFSNQHFNLCPCKKRCFYCRCPIKIPLQNCFYFIR